MVAISLILIVGIQESASVNSVIVVLKVSAALLFIVLGWSYIHRANYTPFIPPNTGVTGEFGFQWSAARSGQSFFFAFIDFDAVSTAAQEGTHKPQETCRWAPVGSLAVCTIIYIVFSYVLTGIVNYKELNVAAPVAVAIDRTSYVWMRPVIKFAINSGIHLRDSGDAAGSKPGLLLDVPRRPAAQSIQRRSPQIPAAPWRSSLLFMLFHPESSCLASRPSPRWVT